MGATVMVRSLFALRQSNTGFDLSNVLTMEVSLVATRYQTPAQRTAFYDAALERIRALPGVEAAATIDDLPLLDGSSQTLALEGSTAPAQSDPVAVQVRQVTPGYLETMRIPVLRGRDVAGSDNDVLLVSREAAKLYWGTDDPIGRRAAASGDLAHDVQRGRRDCRRRQAARPCGQLHAHRLLLLPQPRMGRRDVRDAGRLFHPPRWLSLQRRQSTRLTRSSQCRTSRRWSASGTKGCRRKRLSALLLGVFAGIAAAARFHRHLQRRFVHRARPKPRNRNPGSPRCAHERCPVPRHRRRHDADADRYRRRYDRRARFGAESSNGSSSA